MKVLIFKLISCSIVAAGLVSFVACSSSSNGSPVAAANDSGASSDAATLVSCDGGAGGNLCTSAMTCGTTINGACTVTTVQGAGALPTFTGGPIADGTYFLTSVTHYGATGAGQTQRITMTFTGSAFTLVQDSDASCNSAPSATGTTSISGTQLTLSIACPATDSETVSYTATSTTISYSDGTGSSGNVFAFARQ
jgi:lipocalin-like protein